MTVFLPLVRLLRLPCSAWTEEVNPTLYMSLVIRHACAYAGLPESFHYSYSKTDHASLGCVVRPLKSTRGPSISNATSKKMLILRALDT